MRTHRPSCAPGFSLIETLVSIAILSIALAAFLRFAAQGQAITRAQPDAADLQQRIRVAVDAIQRDLALAGAGPTGNLGPLAGYLPVVAPQRLGVRSPDPELSFFSDRVSILYVPHGGIVARLAADMPAPSADIPIDLATPGCPAGGLCGFVPGLHALILQADGPGAGYNLFAVTGNTGAVAHGPPDPDFSRAYTAQQGRVMPIVQRVYYLDTPAHRLMQYDGHLSDLPLVDHVVSLGFEYYLDPSPRSVPMPPDEVSNCVFAAGSPPVPLLADLGGSALQRAGAAQLTDGPYCGIAPFRFDADLLRIRRIRVTLRAQAGSQELRGWGSGFANAGTAQSGVTHVPDIQVGFDVSPPNIHSQR